jgi:hypothetical protein
MAKNAAPAIIFCALTREGVTNNKAKKERREASMGTGRGL